MIRCIISPINFLSKKPRGNFNNLFKKSDIIEILILAPICKTVDETKIALAAGTEFPKTPVRMYSLEEYLAERGLHEPVTDYTPEEFKIPTDFKGQQKEKMLNLLKENQDDYFNAKKDAIKEFHEKVKRGEIIERAADPQLDKDSIMQATEEYVEEQLQITEASVAMEA